MSVSLARLAWYFLELGATGFGGPIALTRRMQTTLVEERRWIDEDDFADGLALAQLAPGPLAAQLATYIGYVRGGVLGATLVSIAFVLPSFLIVWALSVAYVRFGGLPWIGALFYGVGAAVVAVIARAAAKLASTTLRDRKLLWAIFVVTAVVTFATEREIVWLFIAAGAICVIPSGARDLLKARTHVFLPGGSLAAGAASQGAGGSLASLGMTQGGGGSLAAGAASPGAGGSLASLGMTQGVAALGMSPGALDLLLFFAKAGAFVFGSGLAIVPFLYGEVVQHHHWLSDRQFLDAVAVAMITPGPVVITVAFIGYLVGGTAGMVASAIGVFLPAYLIVLLLARRFREISRRPDVRRFVDGVTAAASGAMAGAALVLGTRAIVDVGTALIAGVTLLVLLRWKRSDVWLIAAAGVVGLVLRG